MLHGRLPGRELPEHFIRTMKSSIIKIASAALAFATIACTSKVDMPKGTSRGYTSARLVRTSKNPAPTFADISVNANKMIQNALAHEFRSNGLKVDANNADLVVGYMIIIQDNASTEAIDDYFGYGRDASEIMDRAHTVGVVDSNRPDMFKAGAIIVDVMDAKTNKLVYRNYAQRDLVGNSDAVRKQRIDSAVAEALKPFFR